VVWCDSQITLADVLLKKAFMDELGVAIVGYHGDYYHGQKKVLALGLIYHGLVVKLLQILTFLASTSTSFV
jgi:hypothetical protein